MGKRVQKLLIYIFIRVSRHVVVPPLLPELKLTRVQRSSLVIIARARREGPGDEARVFLQTCIEKSKDAAA